MRVLATILLIVLTFQVHAKHLHPEKWYQTNWCNAQTRCDCVTTTHAVEFDFGKNWYARVIKHYQLPIDVWKIDF